MMSHTLRFLSNRWPQHAENVTVNVSPISGGLESVVARVSVESLAPTRTPIPPRFIVKELRGEQCREAQIYRALWQCRRRPPAARVFGRTMQASSCFLYLEDIVGESSWPWRDTNVSTSVCHALARVHRMWMRPPRIAALWDYEQDLARSAMATLAVAGRARDAGGSRAWKRLSDLERVVAGLTRMRTALMESGVTFIHGDVHPGNVIVTGSGHARRIVFIDWARARLASMVTAAPQ